MQVSACRILTGEEIRLGKCPYGDTQWWGEGASTKESRGFESPRATLLSIWFCAQETQLSCSFSVKAVDRSRTRLPKTLEVIAAARMLLWGS